MGPITGDWLTGWSRAVGLLDHLLASEGVEVTIPASRRTDIATWLGGYPRALRLFANRLRYKPLDDLLGLAHEAWEARDRQVFVLVYLGMILGGLPLPKLDRTWVALLGPIALVANRDRTSVPRQDRRQGSGLGAGRANAIDHQGVVLDLVTMLGSDGRLALLDQRVHELHHPVAPDADDVVVVMAAVQFEDRLTGFEVATTDEPRRLELGQDPVDSGEPDVIAIAQQCLVDVFCAQVPTSAPLEGFQYP